MKIPSFAKTFGFAKTIVTIKTFSFPKTVLTIDWDAKHLRVLQCRLGHDSLSVSRALTVQMPQDLKLDSPQALGKFIAKVLSSEAIHTKAAVISVPRQHAVLHALPLPATNPGDVPGMMRFQLAQELPFSIEEAAVDYVVNSTDQQGRVTGVIAAAVRFEFIQFIQHVARSAGLKLLRIGLRPHANMACLQTADKHRPQSADQQIDLKDQTSPEQKSPDSPTRPTSQDTDDQDQQGIFFVDLGPDSTEIDVFHGRTLSFSRSAAVTIPLNDQAETALPKQFDELVLEITRTIQAYRQSTAAGQINKAVVAGSTGWEAQFAKVLADQLQVPASIYEPTGGVDFPQAMDVPMTGFSAILGLAMTHRRNETLRFDFLHPKRPVAPGAARSRQVPLAVGAIALVMLVAMGYSRTKLSQRNSTYDQLDKQNKAMTKQVRQYEKFKTRLAESRRWVEKKVNWLEETKQLSLLLPDTAEVYFSQIDMFDSRTSGVIAEIKLKGRAKSSQVVDKLVRKFAQTGRYSLVDRGAEMTKAKSAAYPHSFDLSLAIKAEKYSTSSQGQPPKAKNTASVTPADQLPQEQPTPGQSDSDNQTEQLGESGRTAR